MTTKQQFSKKAEMLGSRWLRNRFTLTHADAERLALHPRQGDILSQVEDFREANGLPSLSSAVVRGLLFELIEQA